MCRMLTLTLCAMLWAVSAAGAAESVRPLALHPQNPHYLLFRGKPAVLVTSGEHYGAVLNRDFDYRRYLDELQRHGLNLTRTFSGTYREVASSFNIVENTLAPVAPERYVCPWARSNTPGAGDGGNKFDLARWNPEYFHRLKDFLTEAGKRGIVVELVLFCVIYDDALWKVNPMNAANNVQGVGKVSRKEVYRLKEPALQEVQEAFVRKVVAELKGFDNLYYELCNEPYFNGPERPWNERILRVIAEAEADLPARHLVAQNIANRSARIVDPLPGVSIFNFHYASPPEAVPLNYDLNKVLADDETGFKGKGDFWYRREGWEFLLSGGAIYSNLDYSFTASRPDGTFVVTTSPGGGGVALRKQLAVLKRFIESFDFIHMRPARGEVEVASGTARALVQEGRQYAVYVHGGTHAELTINLPAGRYRAQWIDTRSGNARHTESFEHTGGKRKLLSPPYVEDIALAVRRIP